MVPPSDLVTFDALGGADDRRIESGAVGCVAERVPAFVENAGFMEPHMPGSPGANSRFIELFPATGT
jgi:hypothetical protein